MITSKKFNKYKVYSVLKMIQYHDDTCDSYDTIQKKKNFV